MTIGDQPAFPLPATDHMHYVPGMTYRQWLVGQIASGTDFRELVHDNRAADEAIRFADAIIKRMEKPE